MMVATSQGEALIMAVEIDYLNALRLARVVSIAARIEPELIRSARLELLPDVEVGAEADLLFSRLVHSHSALALVLEPGVQDILRRQLAGDQVMLRRVWRLLQEVHADAPPVVRMEEELTWLGLSDEPNANERIDACLASIVKSIVEEGRHGLARWAIGALPRLPARVRERNGAWMLTITAGSRLGTRILFTSDPPANAIRDWLSWVLPKDLPSVDIYVRLCREAVELGNQPMEGSHPVELPKTDPLLIEVSWQDGASNKVQVVTLTSDQQQVVQVGAGDVTLRTGQGRRYTLHPPPTRPVTIDNTFAPLIKNTGERRWNNWHGSIPRDQQPVAELLDVWNGDPNQSNFDFYKGTTQGLQALLELALREGKIIRGLGSGWSFSDVAAATHGILLNTRPLNYCFADIRMNPDFYGDASNVFFAQCGISIAELNAYLSRRGKSLKTSGASNGQTIVGAMSTGTHGSAIDVGAIPDFVVGLHVIIGPDRHVWIERASQPIVADEVAYYIGAEIIRDDAIFDAARVSFGSFGLIHGVLLETEDLFYLCATRQRMLLDEALWAAIDSLDFDAASLPGAERGRPYHFSVLIDPHDASDQPYITVMYKSAERPTDYESPSPSLITPGGSALEVIGALSARLGKLSIDGISHSLGQVYPEYDAIYGTLGEIFTDTATRGAVASVGMGVPLGQVRRAVELALQVLDAYPVAGLLALRYVKASDATLAFTRHRDYTCILEFDGPLSQRTRTYLNRLWRQFDNAGIPYTFHWGKLNNLNAQRVLDMYGAVAVEVWRNARQTLLRTPELRRVFANPFLRRVGLDY